MRIWILTALILNTSCALMNPPSRHQNELVSMQTRIMQLEEQSKSKPGSLDGKNLARLQTTVNRLERQLRLVNGQVDAVKAGHGVASSPTAADSATIAGLEGRIAQLESQQKEFVLEIERLSSASVAKSTSKTNASPKNSGVSDFAGLRDLFDRKKYADVLANADKVKSTVKNPQKMEYDYILAESHFALGDMKNAALKYNEYLDRKPKGQAFAHAKLRMGDCFRQLGDLDTAKIYYNEVIAYDSKIGEAKIAKQRLQQL